MIQSVKPQVTHDPTPAQIARRAAAIRANWSDVEKALRRRLAPLTLLTLLRSRC